MKSVTHKVMQNTDTKECFVHDINWIEAQGDPVFVERFRGSLSECMAYRNTNCADGVCD